MRKRVLLKETRFRYKYLLTPNNSQIINKRKIVAKMRNNKFKNTSVYRKRINQKITPKLTKQIANVKIVKKNNQKTINI